MILSEILQTFLSNIFLFLVILKQKLYKEAINGCLLSMVVTAIFQLELIKYLGHRKAEHEMNSKV